MGPLQGWWTARVERLDAETHEAKLYYYHGESESETEKTDLMELVRSGHVSYFQPGLPSRNGPPPAAKPRKRKPRAPKAAPKAAAARPAPAKRAGGEDNAGEEE